MFWMFVYTSLQERFYRKRKRLVMHFKVDLERCKTWIGETLFEKSTKYNR